MFLREQLSKASMSIGSVCSVNQAEHSSGLLEEISRLQVNAKVVPVVVMLCFRL